MKNIKIVQYYTPPYANGCDTKSVFSSACEDPGLEITLLYYKLRSLLFDIQLITVGTMEEMLRSVANGTADMTGTTTSLTSTLFRELTPTNSLLEDKAMFLVKIERVENKNLLFYMCHWTVWAICLALFLLVFTLKLTAKKCKLAYVSRIDQIPYAFWGVVFTVVFYTYTSFLAITFGQKVNTSLPFKTLSELSEKIYNKECTLYSNHSLADDVTHLIPSRSDNDFLAFKNSLNPLLTEPNETSFVKRLLEPGCNVGVIYRSEKIIYEGLTCKLAFVDLVDVPTLSYVFFLRQNFPFREVLEVMDASMDWYDRYLTNYARKRGKRGSCNNSEIQVKPLNLWQLMDCFVLLISGIIIGGLAIITKKVMDNLQ